MRKPYLLEANVFSLLSEGSSGHHDSVFSDHSLGVAGHSALSGVVSVLPGVGEKKFGHVIS